MYGLTAARFYSHIYFRLYLIQNSILAIQYFSQIRIDIDLCIYLAIHSNHLYNCFYVLFRMAENKRFKIDGDGVASTLECPVCLNVPREPPIPQCLAGHIICKDC